VCGVHVLWENIYKFDHRLNILSIKIYASQRGIDNIL
jgi:hypothetical protein